MVCCFLPMKICQVQCHKKNKFRKIKQSSVSAHIYMPNELINCSTDRHRSLPWSDVEIRAIFQSRNAISICSRIWHIFQFTEPAAAFFPLHEPDIKFGTIMRFLNSSKHFIQLSWVDRIVRRASDKRKRKYVIETKHHTTKHDNTDRTKIRNDAQVLKIRNNNTNFALEHCCFVWHDPKKP